MTRLQAALRRRARGDGGFTLVEVMVALTLVTLVMAAFLTVTLTGVAANRLGEQRSRANQLVQQVLEQLKSVPWNELGFYSGDCGYPGTGSPPTDAAVSGEKVVVLGASRPAGDTTAPYPVYGSPSCTGSAQAAMTLGGTSFQVAEHITWTTPPGDNGTHQIKHLTVNVSWVDHGVTRSLTQDATRAPTTSEVPPVAAQNPNAFSVVASASGAQMLNGTALQQAISLTATTNFAASSVVVAYTNASGSQTCTLTSTDNLNWTTPCTVATNLAAGDSAYNAGPLTFTFTATRQSNGAIAQSTSTIQLSAATANFNLTAAIAPTTVTVDSSYITTLKLTLTATTNLSANTVYADYTDAAGNDQSIVFSKGSASGSTQNWSATIATGAGPLPQQSTLPVTFTASGTAGMQQATVQETISPPLLPMQISTQLLLAGQSVNRICIPNNNKTTAAYVVQITITNFDVTNAANTYALTGQSPPNVLNPTPTTSEASGTATISYTIPSNTNFGNNTSQFTFHFSATRKADSQSVQTAPDPAWPLVNTSGSNGC